MKILYHHRTQADDGQAVHVRSLVRAFRELGHEVEEVGLVKHVDGGSQRAAAPGGAGSSWSWITRVPRFARELAEYAYSGFGRGRVVRAGLALEPDFLYERYAFGNAAGLLAARKLRVPLVLEVNSPMVLELERTRGLSFPRTARRMERWILGSADRVCVVTGVLRDMLLELGVAPERLLVTPNGVHLAAYDYGDRAEVRAEARAALGLGGVEGRVIGFVGYYRDWHRLDVVLEALTDASLADAHFVLVGEGPARAALEEAAARLGVTGRVHFAGKRAHDAIPRLLPALDVAVVPAINPYASPLKLHEYMAAALPIVAPDQPNLREVVEHERQALLVPPGDPQAMGAALLRLGREEALRERLGRAAREQVETLELTWTANARRVLASVAPLLDAGAPATVAAGQEGGAA